jgi:hypothetical protein
MAFALTSRIWAELELSEGDVTVWWHCPALGSHPPAQSRGMITLRCQDDLAV